MAQKRTVLLVDDHPIFRMGLNTLLAKSPDYEIAGEADSAETAIRKAAELKPHIIIMGLALPDMNGTQAAQKIKALLPRTHVVILSAYSRIENIINALKAGVSGYLIKDAKPDKLLECLQSILNGEYYLDPSISGILARDILMRESQEKADQSPLSAILTQREQEIVRLIAEGLATRQIAEKLFISEKTVKNHRANIFSKLDVHSSTELVRYAVKNGIIDIDIWKEKI